MNIINNLKNIYLGVSLTATVVGIVGGIVVTRKMQKAVEDWVNSIVEDIEKAEDEANNIIDFDKAQIVDFQ